MEQMTAYDVAQRITADRGWTCTAESFDPGQARLMVREEQLWLGVTTSAYDDVVLLHAGRILPDGTPTNPIVETSAQSTDLDGLLREVGTLWQRLDADGTKHL